MATPPHERLRTPPGERFAPSTDLIDLEQAATQLLQEPASNKQGHRQVALFHHGAETLALYCFDSGGKLPGHVVDGTVMLHLLEGRLMVATEYAEYQLEPGHVLRLARGVEHDITAYDASRLLLTVFVEGPRSHA